MVLNHVDRLDFAMKKGHGGHLLFAKAQGQRQQQQMGPTYNLSRFEQQLIEKAAKEAKEEKAKKFSSEKSFRTADTDEELKFEDASEEANEQEDVFNLFNEEIEVPKMTRKRSVNVYTERVVRLLRRKLQDIDRFSGLTGVRMVSFELESSDSSFFSPDSDQTLHSHRSQV